MPQIDKGNPIQVSQTFISAGSADPLLPQSRELAATLSARGVRVDSLFFPDDHAAALPHEYQFNLDTDEGQLALERAVGYLAGRRPANGAKHDLSKDIPLLAPRS